MDEDDGRSNRSPQFTGYAAGDIRVAGFAKCGKLAVAVTDHFRRPWTASVLLFVVLLVDATCSAADGKVVFEKNCAPCHGKDGKARTPAAKLLGVRDLTQSQLDDAEIEKQIVEGRRDEKGTQKMPPFKDKLTDEEIKALVKVVKTFRN